MKRIICCSDGTWNKPGQKDHGIVTPSNVFKFYSLIEKSNSLIEQCCFYDEGVGTQWYDKLTGGISGAGINKNILEVYKFIASHYQPDNNGNQVDEIYLVGFSRGAYTVRSVAGFIRNCGLLKPEHIEPRIDEAFHIYRRRDMASHPNSGEAISFKYKYSYDPVRIKFIGVWDTVGELGIPGKLFKNVNDELLNCAFHDVKLSSSVEYAYQALAIDEHRKPFLPTLWVQQSQAALQGQVMEQMWFPGAHSDVGGGYRECGLSDETLTWIIDKACALGLEFKPTISIQPNPYDTLHNSMTLLFKLFKKVNRSMSRRQEFNATLSLAASNRWQHDVQHYRMQANPYIRNFVRF